MNNSNYKFKDILFGLRKEYLDIQRELNELKKYVNMLLYDDKIEDVKFLMHHPHSDDVTEMLCFIYKRKSVLEEKLERIKERLFGICPEIITDHVICNDGKYVLKEHTDIIDYLKKEEFSQKVSDILETDFAKNMGDIILGMNPILGIIPSEMYLITETGSISYHPSRGDYISVYSDRWKLSPNLIEDMLNKEFSSEYFSEYHHNLINKEISLDRSISFVGDLSKSNTAQFNIFEESDRLVLKKRRGIGHRR